jgi:hypothetical protein
VKTGFWGLKGPRKGAAAKAAILGAPGPFFESLLEASRYVELYDDETASEPWRRGVSTGIVPSGSLGSRLRGTNRAFTCLIGYPSVPPAFLEESVPRVVFAASGEAPEGLVYGAGDLVIGVRAGRPCGEEAGPRTLHSREAAVLSDESAAAPYPAESLIVIDPLVMDPSLMPIRENIEPGGLTWYPLTGILGECLAESAVRGVHILPRRLPRRDTYPAFVLARLISRLLALALGLPERLKP